MWLLNDLRIYLCTLKYVGVLSVSYNHAENVVHITAKDEYRASATLYALQTQLCLIMVYSLTHTEDFRMRTHNRTGNYYMIIQFWFAIFVLSLLSLYFYIMRVQHARIVQKMLYYNRECLKNCYSAKFAGLYGLYVGLTVMCVATYIRVYSNTTQLSVAAFVGYVTVFPFNFLYLGSLIIFNICIMHIVKGSFRYYNDQLERLISGETVVKKDQILAKLVCDTLNRRHHLLVLCHEDVNKIYGIAMLIITAYILFSSPSGPFYLISVVFEIEFDSLATYLESAYHSIAWVAPWTIIFIVMLSSNGVAKEAHKTSIILSKIPRFGNNEMQRMVDKFLIKNLQQKPILTAYGFFSLDKRTLFNLFTAAFMYMVILVQFKEIERTTKSILIDAQNGTLF